MGLAARLKSAQRQSVVNAVVVFVCTVDRVVGRKRHCHMRQRVHTGRPRDVYNRGIDGTCINNSFTVVILMK